MTPFEKLLKSLVLNWRVDVDILAKTGTMVMLFLFLMFSLVMVKQVKMMNKTVKSSLEKTLVTGSWVLVGLVTMVIVIALIIL